MSDARASDSTGLRVTVDAKVLAAELAVVVRGCASRRVEIISGVRLEADGDYLALSASNMTWFVRSSVSVAASGVHPGVAVLADGKAALALFKSLSGDVTVESVPGSLVVVSFTGATYRLPALDPADFPAWPVTAGASGSVEAAAFVGALAHVLPAVGRDEHRPILCGALVEVGGETQGVRVVATDSYRLAHDERPASLSGSLLAAIPGVALAEVVRLGKRKGAPDAIGFQASAEIVGERGETLPPTHVCFTVGVVELTTRVVDGQYPNWQQFLPDAFEVEHVLVAAEAVAVAKRLGSFVGKTNAPVRLKVEDRHAVLSAVSRDGGDASEALPTPASSTWSARVPKKDLPAPFEIGFSGPFLTDGLAFCGDTVRVKLTSPLRPAVFRGESDSAWYLLMPIRLAA